MRKKIETWIKVGTCFYSYCNETKALIDKKLHRYKKKIPRFNYGLIMCLIWKISWTLDISWVLSLEFLKNILNIPQKSVYRKELTNNNTVNIFSFVKVIKGTNELLYIYILVQVIHRIPLSELYNRQYITGLMYDLP